MSGPNGFLGLGQQLGMMPIAGFTVPETAAQTVYNFFNVKNTRGIWTLVEDGVPDARLIKGKPFISEGTIQSTGEKYATKYWEARDGSGMWRQSTHWGMQQGGSNWALAGPKGWVVSPGEFKIFSTESAPIGFIKFTDLSSIYLLGP
jgi:hypothetical protein